MCRILKGIGGYLFLTILFMQSCAAASLNCNIPNAEKERLLSMKYEEFDQSFGKGWRTYSDSGCYSATAKLIDNYMDTNVKNIENWQKIILNWHAGQLYAFNNDYELAQNRFEGAINPEEASDTPVAWNSYVYATIAFLNDDEINLKYYRDKIASAPMLNGEIPNLQIVDNFIRNIGKPYSIAYSTQDPKKE